MANTIEVWRAKDFLNAIETVKNDKTASETNMQNLEIMQDLDFLDSDVADLDFNARNDTSIVLFGNVNGNNHKIKNIKTDINYTSTNDNKFIFFGLWSGKVTNIIFSNCHINISTKYFYGFIQGNKGNENIVIEMNNEFIFNSAIVLYFSFFSETFIKNCQIGGQYLINTFGQKYFYFLNNMIKIENTCFIANIKTTGNGSSSSYACRLEVKPFILKSNDDSNNIINKCFLKTNISINHSSSAKFLPTLRYEGCSGALTASNHSYINQSLAIISISSVDSLKDESYIRPFYNISINSSFYDKNLLEPFKDFVENQESDEYGIETKNLKSKEFFINKGWDIK